MIKRFLVSLLVTPEVKSLVTHGITSLAIVLVSIGVLDSELASNFVDTNVPVVIGIALWVINFALDYKSTVKTNNILKMIREDEDNVRLRGCIRNDTSDT